MLIDKLEEPTPSGAIFGVVIEGNGEGCKLACMATSQGLLWTIQSRVGVHYYSLSVHKYM